jgi:hypothetical protein
LALRLGDGRAGLLDALSPLSEQLVSRRLGAFALTIAGLSGSSSEVIRAR